MIKHPYKSNTDKRMVHVNHKYFAYVSNSIDGDIGCYELLKSGELQLLTRVKAGNKVMPMAMNQKHKLLYSVSRSEPYLLHTYEINPTSGLLTLVDEIPLIDNFAYVSLDKTEKNIFFASYGSNLISTNFVKSNGHVDQQPKEIFQVGKNAHAILIDHSNRFVFTPTLGSDEIYQFIFDEVTGKLIPNDPPLLRAAEASGPRHLAFSSDNRFLYVLGELSGALSLLSLDPNTGTLNLISSYSSLPIGSTLKNSALDSASKENHKIWASDIHITPNGNFLYTSERTNSTLTCMAVDKQTGRLSYSSSIETEKQPRGFAIDPSGSFLIATGELSNTISSYQIDPNTGDLKHIGKFPGGNGSNWVEIIKCAQTH
mgnify:CR=1 FL=1